MSWSLAAWKDDRHDHKVSALDSHKLGAGEI